MKKFTVISVVLCIMAASAVALDIYPPSWRGDDMSTMQAWNFSTNDMAPVADIYVGPFEAPQASIQGIWQDQVNNESVGAISGIFDTFVDNFPDGAEKKIWVQITWMADSANTIDVQIDNIFGVVNGGLISESAIADTSWTQSVYEFTLIPDPPFEAVTVFADGVWVDGIVIDTIVPEPATIAMLGFGAIAVMRKKRS